MDKIKGPELHLSDLQCGVGVVRDVHEVIDLRSVHLLHLHGLRNIHVTVLQDRTLTTLKLSI
jgi:hypothetical protein